MTRIRSKLGMAILVAMMSLLIYGLTCCRTVYVGDAGELTLALSTGGIAHPPGYPLYTIWGYLWLWLFGFLRPAMAANLFSAAAAAAASVLLFLFLEKTKTKSFPVLLNVGLSLLFAFSFPLWSVATNAEVYAFSALLYNAAMLSIISFYQDPRERRLWIAAFLCGLILTHHFSAAVVLAALLLTTIINKKRLSYRTVVISIAVLSLPVTLYLYLLLRFDINLPVNWLGERSFSALWGMVSGRMYQSLVGWPSVGDLWLLCRKVALFAWGWFGTGVVLLAVPGLIWGVRKKTFLTFLILIPAVLNILMVSFYHIPDFEGYLMPLLFSLIFLFYLSFEWLIDKRLLRRSRAIALAILLVAISLLYDYSRCDLHDFKLAERYGRDLLDSAPRRGILFLKSDNAAHTAMYLRYLENYRPDLEVYTVGAALARLKQAHGFSDYYEAIDSLQVSTGRVFRGIEYIINQGMVPVAPMTKLCGFLYGPVPVSGGSVEKALNHRETRRRGTWRSLPDGRQVGSPMKSQIATSPLLSSGLLAIVNVK